MSFGTFLLYLFLSAVILVVGAMLLLFVVGFVSAFVQNASDATESTRARLAKRKWAQREADMDEETDGE